MEFESREAIGRKSGGNRFTVLHIHA